MRDGTTVKIEADPQRLQAIENHLATGSKAFMKIGDQMVNPVDVSGIYNDSDSTGSVTAIGFDFTEKIRNAPETYNWIVATRSGAEEKLNGKEMAELLEALGKKKSGKLQMGTKVFEILEITTIMLEDDHNRAKRLKSGYWECELGNLHEKGEKYCDKPACYLKNSKRYNELYQSLCSHHSAGNCTLEQHDLGKWHLCETVQKEYNEMIALENYAKGLARYED